MGRKLDAVLVNPGSRAKLYQSLGSEFSAVEPPMWIGILATYLRLHGYSVQILDGNAENLGPGEIADRVSSMDPILAAVIVFGANPQASTMTMTPAGEACTAIKRKYPEIKVVLGGLHVSALPRQTLEEEDVDFVCKGEGPITIAGLIDALKADPAAADFAVPGLWYRKNGQVLSNPDAQNIVDLDQQMPGVAWDLLDMTKYRAHNWHCFTHIDQRAPYGVIYTSLGCPFTCTFCCINAPFGKPGIRYRSPANVVQEIDLLVNRYGVKNIKLIDEMFVMNQKHVIALCDLMIERKYDLNIWTYARVDTVRPLMLEKLRKAGFTWIAYGIESASEKVRDGVEKGFTQDRIQKAIDLCHQYDLQVIGNYIFGLPDDDHDTMRATLNLAKELNCEFANFYAAMAYPGSQLYEDAVREGWELPSEWSGFAQQGYDTLPLRTKHVTAAEVLKFRDEAFMEYFAHPRYLDLIQRKYGTSVLDHVRRMSNVRLRRRILEPVGSVPSACH